jgi:hypothetical protein
MNTMNQDAKPTGKTRWIVGLIVLVAAGVLVACTVVKDNRTSDVSAPTGRAAGTVPGALSDKDTPVEISEFAELNTLAGDMAGVFVILPGTNATAAKAPMTQIRAAVRTIEPQLDGGKIGIFTLKAGSADYEEVTAQVAAPGVIAMVKGGGMAPLSGEITDANLVQAFATASSGGSCGAGGCGAGGCGADGCE